MWVCPSLVAQPFHRPCNTPLIGLDAFSFLLYHFRKKPFPVAMLSPLQGAAIAFGCQNALLFGLIVFFHVGKWNALYTLAVCYRTIQASIAAVGICATTIPVISSRVNLTILMGASLLSEGCLEVSCLESRSSLWLDSHAGTFQLLAQYYLANRLFSEYRPAFWVVFVASCVHSLFAAILL